MITMGQKLNVLLPVVTIDNGPAWNFPENQAQGPDVSLLVGLKDIHTYTLI